MALGTATTSYAPHLRSPVQPSRAPRTAGSRTAVAESDVGLRLQDPPFAGQRPARTKVSPLSRQSGPSEQTESARPPVGLAARPVKEQGSGRCTHLLACPPPDRSIGGASALGITRPLTTDTAPASTAAASNGARRAAPARPPSSRANIQPGLQRPRVPRPAATPRAPPRSAPRQQPPPAAARTAPGFKTVGRMGVQGIS